MMGARINFSGSQVGLFCVDLLGEDLAAMAGRFAASDGSVALESDLEGSVESFVAACETSDGVIDGRNAEFLREWAEALEAAARRLREAGAEGGRQDGRLLRKPANGVSAPGIETHTLTVPVLKTEADCIHYLREDLPEWIDAMGAIFAPGVEPSTIATLFWDLRQAVAVVGEALETGLVPDVWDSIDDEYRGALIRWAETAIDGAEGVTDGLVLLKAARRGLEAEGATQ